MRKPFRVIDGMRSDDPAVAARAYIKAGLRVVVTHGITGKGRCTCGDRDCANPGKHPISKFFPNGAKSATSDMALIRRALATEPDANLAVTLDGMTVVDIDGSEGQATIDELALPATVAVKTGRGKHRYFQGALPAGAFKTHQVDVITGPNRYVMVPPSVHESDVLYRWLRTGTDKAARVPKAIGSLRKDTRFQPSKSVRGRLLRVGERNDALFRTACALRRRISDDETVFEMIKIMNERACVEPLPLSELRRTITSSARYSEETEELFGPPVERRPLPMKWLWYPYIPRYGVTILAGDPGRGKSLLMSMLIGIVTSGRKWPLSNERPDGNRVLLLSAEDNWARVTLHRLLKAGADINNIHVMHKFRSLTTERLDRLAEEIERWKPDLVVIDTLVAYMGDRDTHRQNEVGEFLAMLTEMAEAVGSAVVGLGHLTKQSNAEPLMRIVGSIGFAATIRSAIFLGTDPDNRSRLALAHGKANASVKGQTILFDLEGGGRDDTPTLRPVGFSTADENAVCKVEKNSVGRPSSESDEATDFVLDFLDTDKPVAWDAVRRAAEAHSIASEGTLNTVRAELAKSGKIVQLGKGRNAKWKLAEPPDDVE